MVTRVEVVYYAKCSQTGEIWECSDFKTLYHCVRFSFRSDIHYSHYYNCRGAVLRYGVVIIEDDDSCCYESFRDVGYLLVTGCDGKILKCEFERW